MIWQKIAGIGIGNPLVFGMGHRVSDRVKRLTRPARFRKSGFAATLLIGLGLGTTSYTAEKPYSRHALAPILTSASGNVIQGVPFKIVYITPDDLKPVLAYKVKGRSIMGPLLTRSNNTDLTGYSEAFVAKPKSFPPMPAVDGCIDHVFERNEHVSWYLGEAQILADDQLDSAYIIACIPGEDRPNRSEDLAAFKVDIKTSQLPDTYKNRLTERLTSFDRLNLLLEPNLGPAREALVKHLQEQGGDTSEINLEILPEGSWSRSRTAYTFDPKLSQAERKEILARKSDKPAFRTITFGPDLSPEEREKKMAEWQAELEKDMLADGMIKVDKNSDPYKDIFD